MYAFYPPRNTRGERVRRESYGLCRVCGFLVGLVRVRLFLPVETSFGSYPHIHGKFRFQFKRNLELKNPSRCFVDLIVFRRRDNDRGDAIIGVGL